MAFSIRHIPATVLVVSVLFSSPSLANQDDDSILLHCSGFKENAQGTRSGYATNVLIARDGSWVSVDKVNIKRTQEDVPATKWYYDAGLFMYFDYRKMKLFFVEAGGTRVLSCHVIENPFYK